MLSLPTSLSFHPILDSTTLCAHLLLVQIEQHAVVPMPNRSSEYPETS